MKYGVVFPDLEAAVIVQLAQEAEAAGWDGIFVWDPLCGDDVWVTLAAVAMRTEKLLFGTMLTPPSRRRPSTLAGQVASVDKLSKGRLILSVGLGAPETGYENWGEETDRKTRAKMLDEMLDILDGLWTGEPFSFEGEHYHLKNVSGPKTYQQPRVPVWVVGAWPRDKSMRRVLRCDGLLPAKMDAAGKFVNFEAEDIRAMKAYVEQRRTLTTPFDYVVECETPGDDPAKAAETARRWADGGVTWLLESVWMTPRESGGLEGMRTRVKQGPPRFE